MPSKTRLTLALISALLTLVLFAPQANAAPACIPGFKGPTTEHPARFVNGSQGLHIFWWCPGEAGQRLEYGASCGKFGGCATAAARLLASNFDASTDALWDENVLWVCTLEKSEENSDDGRLCAERLAVLAANTPTWFPAPVWRVKYNGVYLTRPAYTLTEGVLGTREAGRAPVGAVCDLTKPTFPAPNGDIRAEFGTAGLVTICTEEK